MSATTTYSWFQIKLFKTSATDSNKIFSSFNIKATLYMITFNPFRAKNTFSQWPELTGKTSIVIIKWFKSLDRFLLKASVKYSFSSRGWAKKSRRNRRSFSWEVMINFSCYTIDWIYTRYFIKTAARTKQILMFNQLTRISVLTSKGEKINNYNDCIYRLQHYTLKCRIHYSNSQKSKLFQHVAPPATS